MSVDRFFMTGYAQVRPGSEYGTSFVPAHELPSIDHELMGDYLSNLRESGDKDRVFRDADTNFYAQMFLGQIAASEYKQYLQSRWQQDAVSPPHGQNNRSTSVGKTEKTWQPLDAAAASHSIKIGDLKSAELLTSQPVTLLPGEAYTPKRIIP